MQRPIKVTIWNEFIHEQNNEKVRAVYPDGIHMALARHLAAPDLEIRTATLEEPEHGLTEAVLAETEVLLWWGHAGHARVADEIVRRVQKRVLEGMGLLALHSGHFSKIFKTMMGTTCSLKWREVGEKERLWNVAPQHPITAGVGDYFELPQVEMYGERFDIPDDGKLIFISWYEGGNVFRSGVTFERGYGKIFYFSPGHETFPTYHDANIIKVLGNAVRWARPAFQAPITCPNYPALEPVKGGDK